MLCLLDYQAVFMLRCFSVVLFLPGIASPYVNGATGCVGSWVCRLCGMLVDIMIMMRSSLFCTSLKFGSLFCWCPKSAFCATVALFFDVENSFLTKNDKKNRNYALFFQILLSLCIVNLNK
jgi:hypothetical protein